MTSLIQLRSVPLPNGLDHGHCIIDHAAPPPSRGRVQLRRDARVPRAVWRARTIAANQIKWTWVVGTNQGGLDTGTVKTGFYAVHLIQRSDTGVVDVLFSLSAGGPTSPTNYDRFRRIGTLLYASGFKTFSKTGMFSTTRPRFTIWSEEPSAQRAGKSRCPFP